MPDEDLASSVVICDDIRQETNGKQILIGVYGSAILVPAMPFSIPLCTWIEYTTRNIGIETVHVKLSYTTGFSASVRVDIQVHEIGTLGLAMPPLPVSGSTDGELVVEISRDGTAWREIKRKAIRRGQIPVISSGAAVLPPSA
jgi:hypothetical protein